MSEPEIRIFAIKDIPEIQPGDNLGVIINELARRSGLEIAAGDVLVVAQKIISKCEGRIMRLDSVEPSPRALEWARAHQKDARVIELVLREAARIVKMERGVLIVETRQGFVCANAGVDVSNTPQGTATLLPLDPDASAERLRVQLTQAWRVPVGVIISDTFGRPWREGLVNVALGVAGFAPLVDYRGQPDASGRSLQATVLAVADDIASAAGLAMCKINRTPAVLVRGFSSAGQPGTGRALLRPAEHDLFR